MDRKSIELFSRVPLSVSRTRTRSRIGKLLRFFSQERSIWLAPLSTITAFGLCHWLSFHVDLRCHFPDIGETSVPALQFLSDCPFSNPICSVSFILAAIGVIRYFIWFTRCLLLRCLLFCNSSPGVIVHSSKTVDHSSILDIFLLFSLPFSEQGLLRPVFGISVTSFPYVDPWGAIANRSGSSVQAHKRRTGHYCRWSGLFRCPASEGLDELLESCVELCCHWVLSWFESDNRFIRSKHFHYVA